MEFGIVLPPNARYLELHRGHLMYRREDERRFIGPELIKNLTLTGTREALTVRVAEFKDAGYDQFIIQIAPGHESAIEDWARVFGLRS